MLNRKPLAANSAELTVETSAVEIRPVSPDAPVAVAPVSAASDALAGAFPTWDLLPPDAFVKQVVRKQAGVSPTL